MCQGGVSAVCYNRYMGIFGKKDKKGYWTRKARLFRADVYECSVCRGGFAKMTAKCPKCGARMTKSKYDPQWVDELEMWDAIFDD